MVKITALDILALIHQYLVESGLPKLAKKIQKASGEDFSERKNLFGNKKLRKICKFYLKNHPNLFSKQEEESDNIEEEPEIKPKVENSKRKRSESKDESQAVTEKKTKSNNQAEIKKPQLVNTVAFVKSGVINPAPVKKQMAAPKVQKIEESDEEEEEEETESEQEVKKNASKSNVNKNSKQTIANSKKIEKEESEEEEEDEEEEEENPRPALGGSKSAPVQAKSSNTKENSLQLNNYSAKNDAFQNAEYRSSFSKADYSRMHLLKDELQDYSFEAKFKFGSGDDFGKIGYEKLKDTRGTSFRKEKSKLKNKNFQGGFTITNAINSIKLS